MVGYDFYPAVLIDKNHHVFSRFQFNIAFQRTDHALRSYRHQCPCLHITRDSWTNIIGFHIWCVNIHLLRIQNVKTVKVFIHTVAEITFRVKGWIFLLILTSGNKTACLLHMASARTHICCQKLCKLTCPHFFDTTADWEFVSVFQLIKYHTGSQFIHLNQEITDQP